MEQCNHYYLAIAMWFYALYFCIAISIDYYVLFLLVVVCAVVASDQCPKDCLGAHYMLEPQPDNVRKLVVVSGKIGIIVCYVSCL